MYGNLDGPETDHQPPVRQYLTTATGEPTIAYYGVSCTHPTTDIFGNIGSIFHATRIIPEFRHTHCCYPTTVSFGSPSPIVFAIRDCVIPFRHVGVSGQNGKTAWEGGRYDVAGCPMPCPIRRPPPDRLWLDFIIFFLSTRVPLSRATTPSACGSTLLVKSTIELPCSPVRVSVWPIVDGLLEDHWRDL